MQTAPTPFDDGKFFDLLFEKFDFGIEYYLSLAKRTGGPVLDVACGTGRVMLPLAKAGFEVHGVDLFPSMLDRLREKAAALGLQPPLFQSDMSSFSTKHQYALIIIPFNSFVHNLTAADQISSLRCCREHLKPGGLLAFDTFFPGAALITSVENKRDFEGEVPHPETGLPIRMYDTRTFNRVDQLMHSRIENEFLDAAGNVANVVKSETTIRWITKNEMELLLRLAGFEKWEIFGDFENHPLTKDTDAMIVHGWKSR